MTEFEIKQLEQDARRLIVCTGCYGSGEDRWNEGRACPTCSGAGRSAADPRVIELVKALREARAHNEKLIETLKETDVRAAEWLGILEKMERERDEARERCETEKVLREVAEKFHDVAVKERDQARSEAEQLRGALRSTGHNPKTCCCPDCCTLRQVTEGRDKAHAEVERLREAIGNALTNGHMNALCWAQNDEECVGRCRLLRDALKKGES